MKYYKPLSFKRAIKSLVSEIGDYGISDLEEWKIIVNDKRDYYKVSPKDYNKYQEIANKLEFLGIVRNDSWVEFDEGTKVFDRIIDDIVKKL